MVRLATSSICWILLIQSLIEPLPSINRNDYIDQLSKRKVHQCQREYQMTNSVKQHIKLQVFVYLDYCELYIQTMENDLQAVLKINYGSIQDKNQLQNLIVQHRSTITNLIKQVHELTNIKDKEQLEREIIVNKMQENMLQNTRKIINYKNLVNQITEEHQKLSKDFEQQKEKAKKNLQSQHGAQMNDLIKRLQELETEYRSYHETQEKEQKYQQEIRNLKEALILRQYQHHDNMNKEQKRQLKENLDLSSQNQERITQVKKNVFNVARTIVVQEKFTNQQKNLELKTRLLQLQDDLAGLKKQRRDILDKRKDLKINISINQEELEEYKAVGSLQKAKIKANKDKIDQLKILIDEEVSKRQAKINDAKKDKNGETRALKLRLAQLERDRDQMRINIERVKVLADTILLQREEVEQFFIMALDSCKKEIKQDSEKAFNLGKDKDLKAYGDKVDIQQLSPKDKQRILTNLYTKLALGP